MPTFYPLFIYDDEQEEHREIKQKFTPSEPAIFDLRENSTPDILIHQVSKRPKDLLKHLHRIYFCHCNNQSEQLYAALIDLLTILAGKGSALALRLIYGSRSTISKPQFSALEHYLSTKNFNHLTSNQFTLFSENLIGVTQLVEKQKDITTERDYLVMAHDFIEYSQLDSAIEVLERGFLEEPDRKEIQDLLLELYQSTHDVSRFRSMYESALQHNLNLIDKWKQMDVYFSE